MQQPWPRAPSGRLCWREGTNGRVAEQGALAWGPGLQEGVQPMAGAPSTLPAESLEEPAHHPQDTGMAPARRGAGCTGPKGACEPSGHRPGPAVGPAQGQEPQTSTCQGSRDAALSHLAKDLPQDAGAMPGRGGPVDTMPSTGSRCSCPVPSHPTTAAAPLPGDRGHSTPRPPFTLSALCS